MAYHEAGVSNCSNSFTKIIYTVVYMILAFSQCRQNQGCNLTLLKGVMHAIVACYHPAFACMLHLVSTPFGTSIPASFNILLKFILLASQLCVHCIDTSISCHCATTSLLSLYVCHNSILHVHTQTFTYIPPQIAILNRILLLH